MRGVDSHIHCRVNSTCLHLAAAESLYLISQDISEISWISGRLARRRATRPCSSRGARLCCRGTLLSLQLRCLRWSSVSATFSVTWTGLFAAEKLALAHIKALVWQEDYRLYSRGDPLAVLSAICYMTGTSLSGLDCWPSLYQGCHNCMQYLGNQSLCKCNASRLHEAMLPDTPKHLLLYWLVRIS